VDEHAELSDLDRVLKRNGYTVEPDFVIRGRLSRSGSSVAPTPFGKGISVLAAFSGFLVHVFGRVGSETESKLLSSDQLLVREIAYGDVEGVDFTLVEGVGAVVTVSLKGKGGIFQRAIAGGDVILTIGVTELEDYRPLIDQLRTRVS